MLKSALLTSILTIAFATSPCAQPGCVDTGKSLEIVDIRGYNGPVTDVTRLDHLVLVAVGNDGLFVYDMTNPELPWYEGELGMNGAGWELAADGELALMARHDDHVLWVVDMQDSSSPATVNALPLDLPGRPVDMVATQGYAYVLCDPEAGSGSSLVTVELAVPASPTITQTLPMADQAAALDLQGDLLAVAGPLMPNLQLLDLGTPATPALLGSWHSGGLVRDLDLDGTDAWLSGNGVLVHVDITNTLAPELVGFHPAPRAWTQVRVEDGRAFLLSDPDDVTTPGLMVLDLVAVDQPTLAVSAQGGEALAVQDGWLSLAGAEEVFKTIDARELRWIPPLGEIAVPVADDEVIDVAADGTLAVALVDGTTPGGAPTGKLLVMDVGDPTAPVLRGELNVAYEARAVAQQGFIVAAVSYKQGQNRGELMLVDIAHPEAPVELSTVPLLGDPQDVRFRGVYLDVLVRGTNALGMHDNWQVVWLADLENPGYGLPSPLPGVPYAFGSDGNRMVVTGEEYLDYYDLSDPTSPALIDSWYTNFVARSVALNGTDVVFGLDGYLLTGDFATAGYMTLHTSVWLPGTCHDVKIHEGIAYAAAEDLVVVDVSVIASPRWVGALGDEAGRAAFVNDGVVLGAAGRGGVQVLRTHCDGGVGVEPPPQDESRPPSATTLKDPRPNPFNPRITIPFALEHGGRVSVTVHDALGRRVATLTDATWPRGDHSLVWDGRDDSRRKLPAGVYMVHLKTETDVSTRKISLVR